MKEITRDVILDLLPVYVAGEACADTRALVEEFMATDPELRALAALEGSLLPPLIESPPDELEKRALNMTQRLLSRKNWLLGFSLLLTAVPVAAYWFEDSAMEVGRGLILITIVLICGMIGWTLFLQACRRLQATGLEPPTNWGSRIQWGYMGMFLACSVWMVIRAWTGWNGGIYFLGLAGVFFAWVGERLGQVALPEKLNELIRLFGRDRR